MTIRNKIHKQQRQTTKKVEYFCNFIHYNNNFKNLIRKLVNDKNILPDETL